MSKSYVLNVPMPRRTAEWPDAVFSIRLGQGRWEVTHTEPEPGQDVVVFMARRIPRDDPRALLAEGES